MGILCICRPKKKIQIKCACVSVNILEKKIGYVGNVQLFTPNIYMYRGYTVQASDFNRACQKTVKKISKVGIKIWVGSV